MPLSPGETHARPRKSRILLLVGTLLSPATPMTQTADDKPTSPSERPLLRRWATASRRCSLRATRRRRSRSASPAASRWGCSPIFGTTTLLCLVVALVLKLNHPAIQAANQLMYLVQLPLIVVFIRIGESLLGVAPSRSRPRSWPRSCARTRRRWSSASAWPGFTGILGWGWWWRRCDGRGLRGPAAAAAPGLTPSAAAARLANRLPAPEGRRPGQCTVEAPAVPRVVSSWRNWRISSRRR